MNYKQIENIIDYVLKLRLNGAEVKLYARFERIKARQGKFFEMIENKSRDGLVVKKEYVTRDDVTKQLDWIITLDNGRQMIMKDSTFKNKYKVFNEEEGLYISKAIESFVQVDDDIKFNAPWGEVLCINKGDYLNITNPSKIFGVKKDNFHKYYAECDANGKFVDELLNNNTQQELEK